MSMSLRPGLRVNPAATSRVRLPMQLSSGPKRDPYRSLCRRPPSVHNSKVQQQSNGNGQTGPLMDASGAKARSLSCSLSLSVPVSPRLPGHRIVSVRRECSSGRAANNLDV